MEQQLRMDLDAFPVDAPSKEKPKPKKPERPIAAAKAQAKLARMMEAAPAEVDTGKKRADLVRKIEQYVLHFKDKLKFSVPKRVSIKMPVVELEAIVHGIETDLGMTGGIQTAHATFAEFGSVLETITARFNPLGLKLSSPVSLDKTVKTNADAWRDLVTEFAIKYQAMFCSPVEVRLLFFVSTMVLTVHRANTSAEAMQHMQSSGKGKEEASDVLFGSVQFPLDEDSSTGSVNSV